MLAALLAVGVVVGDSRDLSATPWAFVTLSAALAAAFLARRGGATNRMLAQIGIAVSVIALGAFRITSINANRPSPELADLCASHKNTEIFARVDGVPYQKSAGWRLPLELILTTTVNGHHPVRGRVLLTSIPSLQHLRYGDHVRLVGRFRAPSTRRNPGGFDYSEYLFRQGIEGTVTASEELAHWSSGSSIAPENLVQPLRQWIRTTLTTHLPAESGALLLGLLLGDTDRLPEGVARAFRESGTSHLLAVSGANVWLVVGMILWPMYALSIPRWPRTIVALIVIILFSFLTRNEPSVVRASLMVGLILLGRLAWRPASPINAVGAAGVIILLVAPAHLFRAGFQLSFAAVLAILIVARRVDPHIQGWWRRRVPYAVAMIIVSTVAATLATGPVSAANFGTIPVAGVLANIVLVPLAGLTGHLGMILLAGQLISSTLAGWIALVTAPVLSGSAHVAEFFSHVPGAVISWPDPSPAVLAILAALCLLALSWRYRYLWLRPATYVAVGLTVLFSVQALFMPTIRSPLLTFLDNGSSPLAVVADASGRSIWLADDPGIDSDTRQWIVEPFARHILRFPAPTTWAPWRRTDSVRASLHSDSDRSLLWTRIVDSVNDEVGMHHVWGDYFSRNGHRIVVIRDAAALDDTLLLGKIAECCGTKGSLALPGQARRSQLRRAIDYLNPAQVVFFGAPAFLRNPEDALDFWRVRYPETTFYSTGVHGAIQVRFESGGLIFLPTLPDFLSRDA